VYPGMRFCQMRFHRLHGERLSYQETGQYVGASALGAVPSQAHKQFKKA
jgi:deoxycytidine triphosphate deaminase